MKVFFDTIGCRLNQSEVEKMASQFRAAGHTVISSPEGADLVVINTCAVTAEAASDSRQKIRQASRLAKGGVVVTGCWAAVDPSGAGDMEGVTHVVDNQQKDYLVSNILGLKTQKFDLEPLAREPLPGIHQRTRAFIKAQDGCDNFCTYCLTRIARGPARSVSTNQVIADVCAAQAGGTKEVVLTGVHLGAWGKDWNPPSRLTSLVEHVLDQTQIPRLRLSSLEPWDLEQSFFHLLSNKRLCAHLHLPLQSGAVGTLKRMARNTTPELFSELVQQARLAAPLVAITTDVMVGFPGETENEFEESLEFVRKMEFAGGHVFNFSARPGTAAARFPGAVAPQVRKQRSALMRAELSRSMAAFSEKNLGETVDVLWEKAEMKAEGKWALEGLSGNYLRIQSSAGQNLWNEISQVRIVGIKGEVLSGVILD